MAYLRPGAPGSVESAIHHALRHHEVQREDLGLEGASVDDVLGWATAQVDDLVAKLKALSLSVEPNLVRIAGLRLAGEEVSRFLADFVPQAGGADVGGR